MKRVARHRPYTDAELEEFKVTQPVLARAIMAGRRQAAKARANPGARLAKMRALGYRLGLREYLKKSSTKVQK